MPSHERLARAGSIARSTGHPRRLDDATHAYAITDSDGSLVIGEAAHRTTERQPGSDIGRQCGNVAPAVVAGYAMRTLDAFA
jgi:hypothetical protein